MNYNRRDFLKRATLAGFSLGICGLWLPRSAEATSTIASVNSLNNISMLNSTWARSVSLPAAWSKIRLGLLLHFANAGGALASTPVLAAGFTNGTSAIEGDATPTHFVGIKTNSAAWADLGCGSANVLGTVTVQPAVNVAGSETLGTAITADARFSFKSDTEFLYFLDITKGSPNYTLNLFTVIGAGGSCGTGATVAQFLQQVALTSPSFTNHSAGSAQTLAVNEGSNGTLNAVNVYWNRADVAAEIGAIAVAVLA